MTCPYCQSTNVQIIKQGHDIPGDLHGNSVADEYHCSSCGGMFTKYGGNYINPKKVDETLPRDEVDRQKRKR